MKTSEILNNLISEKLSGSEKISIALLLQALEHKGFAFLILLFSIPTAFPVLPPGLSTICGLPMSFLALQLLLNFSSVNLPKFISEKEINCSSLKAIIIKFMPYLLRLEKSSKERLPAFTGYMGERIVAVIILLLAIIISLPIFFANMVPSIGIIFLCLALITKDGILAIVGYIFSLMGVAIAALVIFLGVEVIQLLINKIW